MSLLASEFGWRVVWAIRGSFEDDLRLKMGWPREFDEGIEVVSTLTDGDAAALVDSLGGPVSHVFSGVFRSGPHRAALERLVGSGGRFSLMMEPPFPSRIPTFLKQMGQRGFFRKFGGSLDQVFAIGHLAVDWYRGIGLSESQVVPWAYFPPDPVGGVSSVVNERFQMVYLGQLNPRKGARFMAEALAGLSVDADLEIIGEGEDLAECLRLLDGRSVRAVSRGFVPYADAMSVLASADLCLVPSQHDGWGAVTNEALRRGIPVVCTKQCGSSDFVFDSVLGEVVDFGDVSGFRSAVMGRIEAGLLDGARRGVVQSISERFSPLEGARFFNQVLSEPGLVHRPGWLRTVS